MSEIDDKKVLQKTFVSNILDIKMDIKGGVKYKDIRFDPGLFNPKFKDNDIMITYLFKYTTELFEKAKVPMKYTSFLVKKNKRSSTQRSSFVTNTRTTLDKKRKGSHYFYKLIRYAINNNRIPDIKSKEAKDNMNHNINFMLRMIFKPKQSIFLQKYKYLVHKYEMGRVYKIIFDGAESVSPEINGEYTKLKETANSLPIYKHITNKYYLFYYKGNMDTTLRLAMSWYKENIYNKKLGPKYPELDYVITAISGNIRELRGYDLGFKYADFKKSEGWIIAKLNSVYDYKRYRKYEDKDKDKRNKDIFSRNKDKEPLKIKNWYDINNNRISNANIKYDSVKFSTNDIWVNKNFRKDETIPAKITLYVTSRFDPDKSFAMLDCKDKGDILKKEINKILGWEEIPDKKKSSLKKKKIIKHTSTKTARFVTGGTRKKKSYKYNKTRRRY